MGSTGSEGFPFHRPCVLDGFCRSLAMPVFSTSVPRDGNGQNLCKRVVRNQLPRETQGNPFTRETQKNKLTRETLSCHLLVCTKRAICFSFTWLPRLALARKWLLVWGHFILLGSGRGVCQAETKNRKAREEVAKGNKPLPGPPVVPFLSPFWGEGSPTKIDYQKSWYPDSNLSTRGTSHSKQLEGNSGKADSFLLSCPNFRFCC